MTRRLILAVALALVTLSGALAAPLAAAAPVAPPARATLPDIEDEVMCTVCGVPLQEAGEAPFAMREREFINARIARGETKAQIKRELVAQYGNDVLALPKASGFALAAYAVPVIAVLAGILALAVLAPRWRRQGARRSEEPGEQPPVSPTDSRRLDEELARFDG